MKAIVNKNKRNHHDDNLFGLLSSYKLFNTYIKVLVSEEEDSIIILAVDNPKKFIMINNQYIKYRELRRLEIGVSKKSIKYISPEHLIKIIGPLLGIRLPLDKFEIFNNLKESGYFILKTSLKYKSKVLHGIRKILNLSPQKKYEILEKCLTENQE